MHRDFVSVHVGVLMASDAPTTLDEATAKLIADRLTAAGHTVTPVEVIKDDPALVRAQLESWLRDAGIDVVIALAGFESDAVPTALTPLITKQLTGFSELFRVLTYDEIGTASMLTDVIAAQCGTTFVFVLPASKGAVATALQKILIPQLDHRTKPRNLVMRMPRHKGAITEAKAFPKEDTSPAAAPPPPRASKGSIAPPPVPRRRTSTPPFPLAVVPPSNPGIAIPRTTSDPGMEIDPGMMVDESNRTLEEALERSIEASIEATGKVLPEPAKLDEDHPSMVAAREHAEKTPAEQAASWVQAVEQAASKLQQKAVAERAEREAKRVSAEIPAVPEPVTDDVPSVPSVIAESAEKPKGTNDEPRGKIEKASGKPATKPDRAVSNEDAVIVEDPDLVAAEKRLRPAASVQAPNKKRDEMPALNFSREKEPEVPVFGAKEPPPQKKSRGWILLGGLAVIAAAVLIVLALSKRDGTSAAATDPKLPPAPTGSNNGSTPPATDPTPPAGSAAITNPPTAGSDIEMDPTVARTTDPKTPKPPKPPKDPGAGSDDPDITKAPTNPTTADECDEVSCILGKFAKPCCERFKPAEAPAGSNAPPVEKPPANAGPIELDKTLIRVGVERFRAAVIACGENAAVKGTVKVDVTVRPDGGVDSVSVSESPDPALGNCVAGVMKKATFAKTQKGGSFSYPFAF